MSHWGRSTESAARMLLTRSIPAGCGEIRPGDGWTLITTSCPAVVTVSTDQSGPPPFVQDNRGLARIGRELKDDEIFSWTSSGIQRPNPRTCPQALPQISPPLVMPVIMLYIITYLLTRGTRPDRRGRESVRVPVLVWYLLRSKICSSLGFQVLTHHPNRSGRNALPDTKITNKNENWEYVHSINMKIYFIILVSGYSC